MHTQRCVCCASVTGHLGCSLNMQCKATTVQTGRCIMQMSCMPSIQQPAVKGHLPCGQSLLACTAPRFRRQKLLQPSVQPSGTKHHMACWTTMCRLFPLLNDRKTAYTLPTQHLISKGRDCCSPACSSVSLCYVILCYFSPKHRMLDDRATGQLSERSTPLAWCGSMQSWTDMPHRQPWCGQALAAVLDGKLGAAGESLPP